MAESERPILDFSKLSNKNSVLSLGFQPMRRASTNYSDPVRIKRALEDNDVAFLRNASDYFFSTNGIYSRLVRYMSGALTFDHMVYPILPPGKKAPAKVEKDFYDAVYLLEGLKVKKTCREIVHSVVRRGVYYGYLRTNKKQLVIQDLPVEYCRVVRRFNGVDLVEFDVAYFDSNFSDAQIRQQVLATFPKEVQAGYLARAKNKLNLDPTDRRAWVPLNLGSAVKFSFTGSEIPLFIQVLNEILDLEEAKGIQKQKALQEIAKIVTQTLPLDGNYEPVFDIEEAHVLHNNVVQMLADTKGVDVLTTFADVDIMSVVDKNNNGSLDIVQNARNTVYAEAGVSEQLFATDGNLALEKSILSDESILFALLDDIQDWLNRVLSEHYKSSQYSFGVTMPRITVFTAQKAAELYKGLSQVGFSKTLPAIVTGQSQLSILSIMKFENDVLNLGEKMTPVQMSSTQSSSSSASSSTGTAGRPAKADDEKSEKTIQNITSAS